MNCGKNIKISFVSFIIIYFLLFVDNLFNNKQNYINNYYILKISFVYTIYIYILLSYLNIDIDNNIINDQNINLFLPKF